MTWTKIDDQFWMHPKIVSAGNEGAGIFVRCLSYCGAYLTDGKVPPAVALSIAGTPRKLEAVIALGLLQRLPSGDIYVRDYSHYNPLRDEVEARREQRAAAGRRGGLAKAGRST